MPQFLTYQQSHITNFLEKSGGLKGLVHVKCSSIKVSIYIIYFSQPLYEAFILSLVSHPLYSLIFSRITYSPSKILLANLQ